MTNLEQTFLDSATRYFRESKSKEINWEQRRYEIAKDIFATLFKSQQLIALRGPIDYAVESVKAADSLIEELKKK